MGRPGRHPISPQDSVSALSTGPGLSRGYGLATVTVNCAGFSASEWWMLIRAVPYLRLISSPVPKCKALAVASPSIVMVTVTSPSALVSPPVKAIPTAADSATLARSVRTRSLSTDIVKSVVPISVTTSPASLSPEPMACCATKVNVKASKPERFPPSGKSFLLPSSSVSVVWATLTVAAVPPTGCNVRVYRPLGVTVTSRQSLLFPPDEALIRVSPSETPVTTPFLASTLAMFASSLSQVTIELASAGYVRASALMTLAFHVTEKPTGMV